MSGHDFDPEPYREINEVALRDHDLDRDAMRVLAALTHAGARGLTSTELLRVMSNHLPRSTLDAIKHDLVASGLAVMTRERTAGRTATRWTIRR